MAEENGERPSCRVCGKTPAPSGRAPNKYCKVQACQDVGIAAGHIALPGQKRPAELGRQSPAVGGGSDEMGAAVPPRGELEKIDKIYGCRCSPLPSRPSPAWTPYSHPPVAFARALCPLCALRARTGIAI